MIQGIAEPFCSTDYDNDDDDDDFNSFFGYSPVFDLDNCCTLVH